jgi:cell wall-associated NlpC family hydrolase
MREVTYVSKRNSTARHRATPEKGATLEAMTQALGRSGRQAAVIAAASGMVLTAAPAANAAPVQTDRETSTLPATNFKLERTSRSNDVVTVTHDVQLDLGRADLETTPPPEPEEPVEEVEEDVEPVTAETAEEPAATETETESAETETTTETASAEETESDPAPAASGSMSGVVSAAYSGIGNPYVFGGKTPSGWDCSGFVAWAYAQAGINIPSSTSAILGSGQFTRTSSPQPGDLVFQNGGSHVGIYVGNGQMIGAQNPSVGTILHNVTRNPLMGYYTYTG